jgi:hypothetical protein
MFIQYIHPNFPPVVPRDIQCSYTQLPDIAFFSCLQCPYNTAVTQHAWLPLILRDPQDIIFSLPITKKVSKEGEETIRKGGEQHRNIFPR